MLRLDDLDPDGIKIIVDWKNFVIGSSVFIPCINTCKLKEQCNKISQRKEWRIDTRVLIQDGKLGVRVWRLL